MNKVLVSDFDRTFYLNEEDIVKNINGVKKFRKSGNLFIFATGRSYSDFINVTKMYNIEYDYLILNHGAVILDKNDSLLKYYTIEDNIINEIKNYLSVDKSISNFCCTINNDRTNLNDKDIIKINIKFDDTNYAKELNKTIKSKFDDLVNIYLVSDHTIEIVSKFATKNNAISFISNNLNIAKEKIYTIGDNETDIDMIQNYNGFCMYNSIKELSSYKSYKSVSDLIKNIMNEKD